MQEVVISEEERRRQVRELFKIPAAEKEDPQKQPWQTDVSDEYINDDEFTYIHGTIINDIITFKDTTQFTLHCGKRDINILVDSHTILELHTCLMGQSIHVIGRRTQNFYIAKVICSGRFYKMFDYISLLRYKIYAMENFLLLPLEKQNNIRYQFQGPQYSLADTDESVRFRGDVELRIKYDICRKTYTPQQQQEIETLFAQTVNTKSKSMRKLEYILNISNRAVSRRKVSRKALIRALNKRLYKMDKVKEKIAEYIVASQHTGERGLRMLLVGSPGTGKTTIAKGIAEAYGIPYDVINLNGVASALDLKGLDSAYDGSDAGKIVRSFFNLGTTEAVIVLDEIDKMGDGNKDGNPADSMLDTLSDEHICYDAFLEVPIDTRNTVYIATANTTQAIPDYLLNRFDVVYIDDYEDDDKIEIAKRYMIPQITKEYGIAEDEMVFEYGALVSIVKNYCSDNGARMLKENIKAVVRRVINIWEKSKSRSRIVVTESFVGDVLENFVDGKDIFLRFARNKDKFSPAVRAEIKNTLEHLSARGADAREKAVNVTRAEYLTSLVPEDKGFEQFDVKTFYKSVNESHFGLAKVKEKIAKSLYAKAVQKKSFSSERLLLVGGAGTGKSSICESIARGLNVPYVRIALNGISDERVIKGFAPTYLKADAGEIIKGLSRAGTTRALVQLDELDKLGSCDGVKVSTALFDLLDGCASYTDHFLGVPIDLSNVFFVATANDVSGIEPWLLDRFSVMYLDGYTRNDKMQILTKYLLPKLEREYAEAGFRIRINKKAAELLISNYCTSLGVRDLDKAVREIVADRIYGEPDVRNVRIIRISEGDVTRSLGEKPIPRGNLLQKNVPGFAKALAVTSGNCGMAFSVETVIIPGDSSTCITGLPRESAVDSVKIAKTFIRLNYTENQTDFGLHLHFGEGAVVKDGPSAGVAILISILSALSGIPVAENAAYTGEIDLFGNIYAVGGVIAKIQAAEQSGCSKVFIPYDNYVRLSEEELGQFNVKIVPVKNVREVVEEVLIRMKKKRAKA